MTSVVTNYLPLQKELFFANKGFRFRLNSQRSSKAVRNCRVLCRRNAILLTTISVFELVFRDVYRVANSACYHRHVRPSVCLSVSVSVRIFGYQRVSYWTDFRENWYRCLLRKSVQKFQILLKSDKNVGYFTWRLMHVFYFQRRNLATKALLCNNIYCWQWKVTGKYVHDPLLCLCCNNGSASIQQRHVITHCLSCLVSLAFLYQITMSWSGNGSHPLLWAGSWFARAKITLSCTPYRQNYCATFIVQT